MTLPSLENLIPEHSSKSKAAVQTPTLGRSIISSPYTLFIPDYIPSSQGIFVPDMGCPTECFPLQKIRCMIAVAQEIAPAIENVYKFSIFNNSLIIKDL
jgi:hypothetical protein